MKLSRQGTEFTPQFNNAMWSQDCIAELLARNAAKLDLIRRVTKRTSNFSRAEFSVMEAAS